MGFFDRFRSREDAPVGADARVDAPLEVLQHRQHECVEVRDTNNHQDALAALPGDSVEVKVRKKRKKDGFVFYSVTTADDVVLGELSETYFKKAGISTRGTVSAEIARPVYLDEDSIALFIPITTKAKAKAAEADAMKLWINLNEDKWEGGSVEDRIDLYGGELLVREFEGSKKPVLSVVADGRRLFSVGSRMKVYGDLMDRRFFEIRHLIVEKKESDSGLFYRVGFYF